MRKYENSQLKSIHNLTLLVRRKRNILRNSEWRICNEGAARGLRDRLGMQKLRDWYWGYFLLGEGERRKGRRRCSHQFLMMRALRSSRNSNLFLVHLIYPLCGKHQIRDVLDRKPPWNLEQTLSDTSVLSASRLTASSITL